MLLGTLLKALQSSDHAADLLAATGDLALIARVSETGTAFEETPGEYAANAAARFSRQASDEDWLALMTALEKAENPAQACLGKILDWALREDAASLAPQQPCTCGHAAGECHGSG